MSWIAHIWWNIINVGGDNKGRDNPLLILLLKTLYQSKSNKDADLLNDEEIKSDWLM